MHWFSQNYFLIGDFTGAHLLGRAIWQQGQRLQYLGFIGLSSFDELGSRPQTRLDSGVCEIKMGVGLSEHGKFGLHDQP
jgi:hypothetical protein